MNEIKKNRGATFNPQNRFVNNNYELLEIELEENEIKKNQTQFFVDKTKSLLSKNDSPDIPYQYSLNPYRGCEHGCIYCYARPTHEYLGFSSGIDFETKIMVKLDASNLLEKEFQNKNWIPQLIVFSGNTDCYQPIERKLKITRECLKIFLKYKNPVSIITKNALIKRDIDILKELASMNLVSVFVSLTSLKNDLINKMEVRTSRPQERLEVIQLLAKENINVGINIAPIIPSLNDEEIPSILKAASEYGAKFASYVILRLPYSVKDIFENWLNEEFPERSAKIINKILEMKEGKLNNPNFFERFQTKGKYIEVIKLLFRMNCQKYGLNKENFFLRTDLFERDSYQLKLF